VDPRQVAAFFAAPLGRRLLASSRVLREVPFNLALPAAEIYGSKGLAEEKVLIQGVIDCLFEEGGSLVLVDFKTDTVGNTPLCVLKERYRLQLGFYARAVETIWRVKVKERCLYFFDRGLAVFLEAGETAAALRLFPGE
jgi:ATP-dependent helicase/nuclease subunit A